MDDGVPQRYSKQCARSAVTDSTWWSSEFECDHRAEVVSDERVGKVDVAQCTHLDVSRPILLPQTRCAGDTAGIRKEEDCANARHSPANS